MNGRHTGPQRTAGDVNATPLQRDVARKLTGCLLNQHALGGPSTATLHRTLADGSTIVAQLVDGVPQAYIRNPGKPEKVEVKVGVLTGFVTKPRNNGTFSANDGQNAFGLYAHALVNGKPPEPGDAVVWSAVYLDDTYLPTGEPAKFYGANPDAKAVFPDGLLGITNTHWKNATENLCLSWYGSREQAGQGSVVFDYGTHLYRNGQIIISGGLDLNFGIAAACIRKYDGVPYVLYAVGTNGAGTIHVYRSEIEKLDASDALYEDYTWVEEHGPVDVLLHPRWKPKAHSASTLLLTYNPPNPGTEFWGGEGHGYLSFNQSGTELRGLRLVEAPGLTEPQGTSSAVYYVYETVIDVSTPEVGFVSGATELLLIDQRLRTTTITGVVLQANGYNIPNDVVTGGPPSPGPIPDGTYAYAHTTNWEIETPVTDPTPGGSPSSLDHDYAVKQATVTVTETNAGPVPVTVAYEDDVPVYMYWDPGVALTEYVVDALYTQEVDYEVPLHTVTYSGGSKTQEVKSTNRSEVVTATANNSLVASRTGARLYAVDKNGVTWFEHEFPCTATGAVAATLNASYDGAITDVDNVGSPDSLTGSVNGEVAYEGSRNLASNRYYVSVPYLDLASKSIIYYVREVRGTNAASVSFSGSPAAGLAMPPQVTLAYGANTQTSTSTDVFQVFAWMYGEQVYDDEEIWVSNNSTSAGTGVSLTGKYISAPYMVQLYNTVLAPSMPPIITGSARIGCNGPADSFNTYGRGLTGGFTGAWRDAINAVIDPYRTPGPTQYAVDTDIAADDVLLGEYSNWYMGYNAFIMSGTQRDFGIMGMSGYGASTDTEPQPGAHDSGNFRANTDGMGHAITHRGMWAFCIPVFDHLAVYSPFTERWVAKAGHKDSSAQVDLDDITGGRGAEIFGAMWPLSTCLYRIQD